MRLLRPRPHAALLLLCALVSAQAAPPPQGRGLLGFDAAGAERQRELERRFDSLLKKENLREWMKRMSSRPHHVGSPHDRDNAEFMAGLFRSWGYDAQIESFDVLFPTPKVRVLEMTAPARHHAESPRA
jgi:N-acetylated-alpha-linked acidic dipeptidase